ncbi:MAG: formate acetyltransferase, partial [Deltaproteobacteria bacterium]|nr:formate acetyltransferase [Deltaproteobacteria bacterium]
ADLATRMAEQEPDEKRRKELEQIAAVCRNVPRKKASSFREAVQSIFFAQIALNLESLDNAVCPGRMDQYLLPFYENDINKQAITENQAKEVLAAFSIKLSEIIPVFSEYLTGIHGGMFNGQVVTVGGTDKTGKDATNALSYMFLDVMDELRMRQPNYHARICPDSPEKYTDKINAILLSGSNSPALYNDEIIVETMCKHGYDVEDARNYTGVGCVEPVAQGKSFASTDAALANIPIILEMALNSGRRFNAFLRSGLKTIPAAQMRSIDDVTKAFEAQLGCQIDHLINDLQAIETANRKHHPTPWTSSLLEGCLQSGKCSTAGGARYNFSGIQCVAPADTGDALYAIEKAVFIDQRISLPDLVKQLKKNIPDTELHAYLCNLGKFGNDEPEVDKWTDYVVDRFIKQLNNRRNTRGGQYVAGLYSVTIHEYYGRITGALPHGRLKGEPFASGISPGNGADRQGPTALINSANRIDFTRVANGINFNLKFNSHTLKGNSGKTVLDSLLKTYFQNGGMQAQVNVLDHDMLVAARDDPKLFPNMLVRVSGYSAYFNDLSIEMKDEIIKRSYIRVH